MSTLANLYADCKALCQQWFYTKAEVDTALENLVDVIYPVGSIYMSTNSTSPATLFGGTWEQIEDRFLLASGTTYSNGATGGSANAVIVSHSHKAISYAQNAGSGTNRRTPNGYNASGQSGTFNTETVGEDGTGKNMPPYLVVNVWKRTA